MPTTKNIINQQLLKEGLYTHGSQREAWRKRCDVWGAFLMHCWDLFKTEDTLINKPYNLQLIVPINHVFVRLKYL